MEDVRPAAAAADIMVAAAAAAVAILAAAAVVAAEDPRSSDRVVQVFECTEAGKTTRVMAT
jgi:16S rRNA C1402 (ribose-2'-O) methylase RsmI